MNSPDAPWRSRAIRVLAAALTATLLPLGVAVGGAAATGSCGSTSNYFDGGITTSPVYYLSGTITDRNVALCSSNPNTSGASAWLMIAGGGASEYAQIGFARVGGMSSTMRFTEYNDGSNVAPGWARGWYSGFSAGSNHSYVVSYSFTTGRISMTVDGSTKATTPWGADTSWSPGWEGQVFGETWNTGDDVPGTASARTNFGSLLIRTCRSCSLVTPSWTMAGSDLSYYQQSWSNNGNFSVWTQR